MQFDFKVDLVLSILLFIIIGAWYMTSNDIEHLTTKLNGYRIENHDIRKRIDLLDDKIVELNKRLQGLNN